MFIAYSPKATFTNRIGNAAFMPFPSSQKSCLAGTMLPVRTAKESSGSGLGIVRYAVSLGRWKLPESPTLLVESSLI